MLNTQARWISWSGRAVATVALIAGSLFLNAQTTSSNATVASPNSLQGVSAPEPVFHLQDAASSSSDDGYSSSSAQMVTQPIETTTSATELASNATHPFHFLNAMQYGGGRQRYGRPRYRGGNTNADGSPKYDFFAGGGFGVPTGNQFNYATAGWGFGGGGGRMFNAHVGVNLEFNYDHFGMSGATVNNQENLYNNYITLYCNSDPTDCANNNVTAIAGLGGNNHIWSFTLDPIFNLRKGEGLGAYVTGGAGFYHKVANFTEPSVGEECDPYYGCYEYEANQNVDHYTSNAMGVNGGFGVTYKFSRFASERLYGEVRYVYIFNSARSGVDAATCNTLSCASDNASVANEFPQNSQRTSYFPVKFGIRF